MKAFINRVDGRTGQPFLPGIVTGDYKRYQNLLAYALRNLSPGWYEVETFFNWENRYGEPDRVQRVLKRG